MSKPREFWIHKREIEKHHDGEPILEIKPDADKIYNFVHVREVVENPSPMGEFRKELVLALAERCDVSVPTIERWLAGTNEPHRLMQKTVLDAVRPTETHPQTSPPVDESIRILKEATAKLDREIFGEAKPMSRDDMKLVREISRKHALALGTATATSPSTSLQTAPENPSPMGEKSKYHCPHCDSTSIVTERRPDGNSYCQNCAYNGKTVEFVLKPSTETLPRSSSDSKWYLDLWDIRDLLVVLDTDDQRKRERVQRARQRIDGVIDGVNRVLDSTSVVPNPFTLTAEGETREDWEGLAKAWMHKHGLAEKRIAELERKRDELNIRVSELEYECSKLRESRREMNADASITQMRLSKRIAELEQELKALKEKK